MDNFEVINLTFEEDGKSIFGRIYLPNVTRKGERVPLVIIAHGLGGNHESGDGYARECAKRGYAAYCFDFGNTAGSRSTGDPLQMTLSTLQNDLEFVYAGLAEMPYVDLNNVFFMGMSMGGAVAALVASHLKGLIKGLILLYPGFNIPAEIQSRWRDRDNLPETVTVFGTELGKAYLEDAYYLDFYNIIGKYTGPVLIIHGVRDEAVASGYSVRAASVYKHAQLELIDGVGHGFEGGAFKYAVKRIIGFLDEEADLPDESGLDGDLNFGSGGMFG